MYNTQDGKTSVSVLTKDGDEKGRRGKMYQLFGAEMNDIINELNEVLAASWKI